MSRYFIRSSTTRSGGARTDCTGDRALSGSAPPAGTVPGNTSPASDYRFCSAAANPISPAACATILPASSVYPLCPSQPARTAPSPFRSAWLSGPSVCLRC